jgi:hypothetical protein
MRGMWSSVQVLALAAAACYVFVPLLSKKAMVEYGVSPTGLLMCYGMMSVMMSLLWSASGVMPISLGTSLQATMLALAIGLMTSFAFILMNRALSFPAAPVAMVLGLITVAPMGSAIFDIIFKGLRVDAPRALIGCTLIVVGAVVLLTSKVPTTAASAAPIEKAVVQ